VFGCGLGCETRSDDRKKREVEPSLTECKEHSLWRRVVFVCAALGRAPGKPGGAEDEPPGNGDQEPGAKDLGRRGFAGTWRKKSYEGNEWGPPEPEEIWKSAILM